MSEAKAVWNNCVNNKDLTEDECLDFFAKWAPSYEQDLSALSYVTPQHVASKLASLVPEAVRSTYRVLDVAAGTGWVGHFLQEQGFKTIDGVDACEPMLELLRSRNLYGRVLISRLGHGNHIKGISDGEYEAVTIAGAFAQSQLPVDSLLEVARVLKKGGYFVNGMTEYYLESVETLHALEPLMAKMEADGVWKRVERTSEPNILAGNNGLFHVYQKL